MNAKSGKDSKAPAAKASAHGGVVAKGKPVVSASAKAVAHAAVKPAPKAQPAAKPASKAGVVKPAAQVTAKAVGKAAKPAAKTSAAPTKKPGSKSPPPSPSNPRALTSPAPMPVSKTSAKPMQTTVPTKPKSPVSSNPSVEKIAPVAAAPVAATAPAKAGRPSSRLAQLTVPSMAQTVASTAAKASYAQSAPSNIIVPALPSSVKKDPKLANNWKTTAVAELTDAELMAMPDSEYMNSVQLAVFRLKLTKLKLDILNSAGETTEHLREDTSVVPDPADRATIEEEHALELRTRDRERKLLKKIEQSIGRIDAGDYGYCDETGEPIGVGRLLARPTATLSLEAQQRRELKQKMFGD